MYQATQNPKKTIIQPRFMVTTCSPTVTSSRQEDLPEDETAMFEYILQRTEDRRGAGGHLDYFNPLKDIPIVCPINNNMFITNFHGPNDTLTVILIGNEKVPDVSMYASIITKVEFVGHLSFTGPIFEIVAQLPKVTKVKIHVGQFQLPLSSEFSDFEEKSNVKRRASGLCPQVREFQVTMDLDAYLQPAFNCEDHCKDECWKELKNTYDSLFNSILKRASYSFPRLSNLSTELPETDFYSERIASLTNACPLLSTSTLFMALQESLKNKAIEEANTKDASSVGDNADKFPMKKTVSPNSYRGKVISNNARKHPLDANLLMDLLNYPPL